MKSRDLGDFGKTDNKLEGTWKQHRIAYEKHQSMSKQLLKCSGLLFTIKM